HYYQGINFLKRYPYPGFLPEVITRLLVVEQHLNHVQEARELLCQATEACREEPQQNVVLASLLNIVNYYILADQIQEAEYLYAVVTSFHDPFLGSESAKTQEMLIQRGGRPYEMDAAEVDLEAVLTRIRASIQPGACL
ncbi:MAG: hypothetical protein K8I60_04870, partial [Anaerolineae bacterium]|nr:hypothetical protein [Anaerolineae bacterium]